MPGLDWTAAPLAALPFAVISSAVAIPSATRLPDDVREFVVCESSVSDILGVLMFYAWLDASGDLGDFAIRLVGSGLSLVAAAFAAMGLYYLINKAQGHARFLPLLAGLLLVYAIGKAPHLSPLVLVLGCGLLRNNPQLLERSRFLSRLHEDGYDTTLKGFKGLVAELAFATKNFFFLLLGYWADLHHMANPAAWLLALVMAIYLSRYAILALLRQPDATRLVWIAPRGLITVLLFITATKGSVLGEFPFGTVMLVVLATASVTALTHRKRKVNPDAPGHRPWGLGERCMQRTRRSCLPIIGVARALRMT